MNYIKGLIIYAIKKNRYFIFELIFNPDICTLKLKRYYGNE
jgi:hypothetical protein